jgi:hypothetical protein
MAPDTAATTSAPSTSEMIKPTRRPDRGDGPGVGPTGAACGSDQATWVFGVQSGRAAASGAGTPSGPLRPHAASGAGPVVAGGRKSL